MGESTEQFWAKEASKLKGKVIKEARYMTQEEADEMGWYRRPLVIFFTDGSQIFPSKDDEGNDAGSIFGAKANGEHMDFPVLR